MKENIFECNNIKKEEKNKKSGMKKFAQRAVIVGGLTAATLGAVKYGDKIVDTIENTITPEIHKSKAVIDYKEHIDAETIGLRTHGFGTKREKWILHLSFDGKKDTFELQNKEEFDSYSDGDTLNISYKTGGTVLEDNGIHIESIEK